MKTRFSSKTSTRLAAVIAVIAVMGSFAGCSATITSESTGARETTEATTEAATEAATEETTTAAATAEETTADAQAEPEAPPADNESESFPEIITSIDDNLFGIDIPVYDESDPSDIEFMVNIREGDQIELGSGFDTLIPVGNADADVVYIVYNEALDPDDMGHYCEQFVIDGYVMDTNTGTAFAGDNDEGYRVVAQTLEGITTVAVYDHANNPNAGVAGVG